MRVLLVNDWTATGGGVERYVLDMAAGLRSAGDDVHLLAADTGDAASHADTIVKSSDRAFAQSVLQVVNPFAVRAARSVVRSFRPDVAYVAMFEMRLSPAALAALRPTPMVLNVAYYKPVCPTGLKLRPDGAICFSPAGTVCVGAGCIGPVHAAREVVRYAFIHREVRRARAVVTCSAHMRERLAGLGIDARFHPWPTGAPSTAVVRRPSVEPAFVYVGRLAPEKGILELLDAFEQVIERVGAARLEIAGDGPLRGRVEAEIERRRLAGNVAVHGWLDRAELDEILATAWATVVPSQWEEPLGLVAVESIVRGVPVIASAMGGLTEAVEDGRTGLLVPRDQDGLGAGLLRVATREAFPEQRVDEQAVNDLLERHDAHRHVDWLRRVLGAAAA
jgi:glycosyltransferase involved in cell wall biosynthesis